MEEYAEASVSTTISSSSRCGKESTTKCDDEDEIIFGDEEHLPADRRRKEVTHYVNDLTESPEPVPQKRSRVDP